MCSKWIKYSKCSKCNKFSKCSVRETSEQWALSTFNCVWIHFAFSLRSQWTNAVPGDHSGFILCFLHLPDFPLRPLQGPLPHQLSPGKARSLVIIVLIVYYEIIFFNVNFKKKKFNPLLAITRQDSFILIHHAQT